MSRCKATEIPRNEAYIEVRRRWAFFDSLLDPQPPVQINHPAVKVVVLNGKA
jgi:hypothetical protein